MGPERYERAHTLLREHRRAAELTQRELADAARVSIGVIRDLEQGRTVSLRAHSGWSLSSALGLDESRASEFMLAICGQPAFTAGTAGTAGTVNSRVAGLRLSMLGPLTGSLEGRELQLGTSAQRAVLAMLALSPDVLVHRESIIDVLWADDPPASAVNQVQKHVGRLRRVLDPGRSPRDAGGRLVSTGTSYRLRVKAPQLDLLAYRDLVTRAHAARRGDGPAIACKLYTRALELWRGDPLADVDAMRRHPAVHELREQRIAATIAFAETASDAGWYELALPHLSRLTASEPLHEYAHALLMTALAGNGQRAAALQVFENLRQRLASLLGMSPCAEVSAAQRRVLRGEIPSARRSPGLTAQSSTA
jgi:DNA-binding SARP family transcriptional activator/transcriptional regulator with XRE-family HTH domain